MNKNKTIDFPSYGISPDPLFKYIDRTLTSLLNQESIEETKLYNQEEKLFIIFGKPGSDKSILLSKLYETI